MSEIEIFRQSPESVKVVCRKIQLDVSSGWLKDCGGKMAMTLFPDTPIFEPQELSARGYQCRVARLRFSRHPGRTHVLTREYLICSFTI